MLLLLLLLLLLFKIYNWLISLTLGIEILLSSFLRKLCRIGGSDNLSLYVKGASESSIAVGTVNAVSESAQKNGKSSSRAKTVSSSLLNSSLLLNRCGLTSVDSKSREGLRELFVDFTFPSSES